MTPLLEVDDLRVCYDGTVQALRGASFTLDRGERLAIVGESGAGKSTLAQSLVGLVQPPAASGSVRLAGRELIGAGEQQLRALRWKEAAIALQGAPFNPVVSVGAQIAEPLREHRGLDERLALRRAAELADEVLLDPALLERFPHQLSGGERRRAMLAMALALDPPLLILDEPAAGLDPITKQQLVDRVAQLARQRSFALVVVSHDLPSALALGERTLVLYAGEVIEEGDSAAVLNDAAHPYTWSLVRAYPMMTTTKDLRPIRGRSPGSGAVPGGCAFHPRCTQAEAICASERPLLERSRGRLVACHFGGVLELLRADGLTLSYGSGRTRVLALNDASLSVKHGEAVGVIGASGSGKTTLARILSGDLKPDSGTVVVGGEPLSGSWRRDARRARRAVQLVRQDPWDALSPRLEIGELVREPLDLDGVAADAAQARVTEMLEAVGLPASGEFQRMHTHNLSGGELQRVALARALCAQPKLLIADEPTSMLDASEQARLLVIMRELQVERGLCLVFVSHDVAVVRKVTDRTIVVDGGRIVEEGPSELICSSPRSEAGRRLITAAAGTVSSAGSSTIAEPADWTPA